MAESDPTPPTFLSPTVEQLAKMAFKNEKTKFSQDSLDLTCEMLRIYTIEIFNRARMQAQSEGCETISPEHIEKILPQLLLDFT